MLVLTHDHSPTAVHHHLPPGAAVTGGSGRRKRQTVTLAALETAVSEAERGVLACWTGQERQDGESEVVWIERGRLARRRARAALLQARMLRNRLTDGQWEDSLGQALCRRLNEAEHLNRSGGNPVGALQERIDAALALLRTADRSPLTDAVLEVLEGRG